MSTSREDEDKSREEAYKAYRRAQDPVERMRLFCLSRGQGGINALGGAFRGMDDSDNRELSKEEFIRGLSSYGAEMSRKEMEDVFNALDKDKSGFVNFDEFLQAMRPPMSRRRVDIIIDAFESLDLDRDDLITTRDIERRIDMSHHDDVVKGNSSTRESAKRFIKNFDSNKGDGMITKDEFFNYYAGVSASVDDDEYFEYMITRAYRLDGGRGSYGRDPNGRDGSWDRDRRRSGDRGRYNRRDSRDYSPRYDRGRRSSYSRDRDKDYGGGNRDRQGSAQPRSSSSRGIRKSKQKEEDLGHWWYGNRVRKVEDDAKSDRSGGRRSASRTRRY